MAVGRNSLRGVGKCFVLRGGSLFTTSLPASRMPKAAYGAGDPPARLELGQFVQEEDAVMGQAHLARLRDSVSPGGSKAQGMVGRAAEAEWWGERKGPTVLGV